MSNENDRALAVLAKALSVCRGMLYSARTGDATTEEIERVLEGTGEDQLIALIGDGPYRRAADLADALSKSDKDALLGLAADAA